MNDTEFLSQRIDMLTARAPNPVDHPCIKHKNLEMTLVYARIADRTVADEYFDVTTRVDQIYGRHLPANLEGLNMRRLRQQHRRMLGNGWCDRPADMDCHYETICETCTYYTTDTTHTPVLIRQRDHANDHHQPGRAKLYDHLINTAQEPLQP